MKKILLSMGAILLCMMMASCGGNPAERLKSIADDVAKNGNDWTDVDQWESVLSDAYQCVIDFANSDPSKEEYKEFEKAWKAMDKAWNKVDDPDARDACRDAKHNVQREFGEEFDEANRQMREIRREFEKDDDDDDD